MVELRTLAIEASDPLHAGQWQHLETVSQRWHEKDPKAGMAWLLAAQAADKLESPGRMACYIERMPDEDPNKLSWSRFWGPRVLLVSAFDDCFKLAR